MSRKKIQIPTEDLIIDYFMTAPRESIEGQLRAINRIVLNRFPVMADVKGNGKGAVKPAKVVKPALGAGLGGKTPKPVILDFDGEQHELKPIESVEAK